MKGVAPVGGETPGKGVSAVMLHHPARPKENLLVFTVLGDGRKKICPAREL